MEEGIEVVSAVQIETERLFHHHPGPASTRECSALAQAVDGVVEDRRRDSQIEGPVAAEAFRRLDLFDSFTQGFEAVFDRLVVEVPLGPLLTVGNTPLGQGLD